MNLDNITAILTSNSSIDYLSTDDFCITPYWLSIAAVIGMLAGTFIGWNMKAAQIQQNRIPRGWA